MAVLLSARANWGAALVLVVLALTVPGVLALRAARIPSETVRGYPIYVPASSLLVIVFAGLGWDLIGPLVGVSRPLQGVWSALAVLVVGAALWIIGLGAPRAARLPWRETLARPALLAPLLLPAAAAAGALELTNGAGGALARVTVFAVALAIFACLIVAPRLDRPQIAMILFGCALAALWSYSLRSQEIVGFDISTELFVAKHTQHAGIWHALHPHDAYGAMLSITVLPSALASMTGLSPEIAFKVLYPALTALLPVSVFLVGDRLLTRRFAVGAAAALLVQSYFFQLLSELARQEIALIFFAALIAALVEVNLHRSRKATLAVAMALGMIVAHYSSTYLAIPLVVVALVLRPLVGRWRGLSRASVPVACAAVALIGGSALWYGAITHSASNVSSFAARLDSQGLDLLPSSKGGLVGSYLNGNNVRTVSAAELQRLAVAQYRKQAPYVRPRSAAGEPRYDLRGATVPQPPSVAPALTGTGVTVLHAVFNELLIVLFALGSIAMVVRRRGPPLASEVGLLGCGALAFLLFIRFSGTGAAEYNQTRALLQSLILLAIPAAWLLERLTARLRRHARAGVIGLACVAAAAMFVQQSGALNVVLGGGSTLNLYARGEDFERLYVTPAELAGAAWVQRQAQHSILYADRYGQLRIAAVSGRSVLTNVMPQTLDRYGWVYGTRTNVRLGRARTQVQNASATYRWPESFLQRFYDRVYDDGDSQVFHGS
ncbi:MAG: hypothetical protein ACRDMX_11740 [Solirubrobacteraceae bacterium]